MNETDKSDERDGQEHRVRMRAYDLPEYPGRRAVGRQRLRDIIERLTRDMKTSPPTFAGQPREVDIELFKLFDDLDCDRPVRQEGFKWMVETRRVWITWEGGDGIWYGDYAICDPPQLDELSHYTSNTDDAMSLVSRIRGQGRKLVIEELEDEWMPRWKATVVDGAGNTKGTGESYDCGAAIILATLEDLCANDGASLGFEAVD